MGFDNLIDSAEKTRIETVGREERIKKAIAEQMRAIQNAKKAGRSDTCWMLDTTTYEDVQSTVKEMFIENGLHSG